MLDDQTYCKRYLDDEDGDGEQCGKMVTRCTAEEEFVCDEHGERESELTITPLLRWARSL